MKVSGIMSLALLVLCLGVLASCDNKQSMTQEATQERQAQKEADHKALTEQKIPVHSSGKGW